MRLIKRGKYLNKLISVIGTPDIKVITGIRRSGKSKLLEDFKNYIENNIENYNIIHINFSLPKFEKLKEYHRLYEYIDTNYKENMNNFVLIDEVQMCEGFEKTINSLHTFEPHLLLKNSFYPLNTVLSHNYSTCDILLYLQTL